MFGPSKEIRRLFRPSCTNMSPGLGGFLAATLAGPKGSWASFRPPQISSIHQNQQSLFHTGLHWPKAPAAAPHLIYAALPSAP